ncbi:MAG TPA: phosphotransferase [Kineosporiaceae bacterium]|nr:phosphotransferase [Kineosporiaceae bacterium]
MDAVPLASGRDADVYAVDECRVLRRYRDGGDVAVEAQVMRHVAAHGFPVPIIHHADGRDLVMERLDGPTMLSAIGTGALPILDAAALLADLHHDLHQLPALSSQNPTIRILHLDLHPDNVMLTSRGPVVIDWRNAREGPERLDVAMSAIIIAQAAVEKTQDHSSLAAELLPAFLRSAGGCPVAVLDQAMAMRQADPNLTPEERTALPMAAALVRSTGWDCGR